jgi:drug/metabolite transporter (DMT)-like permease
VAKGLKLNMNILYLLVPAFFDLISSTLQYTSLNFVSASIYQMMRGGTVLTTFIFSILFLKLKIKNFQLYGCALVLLGVIVVGVNNMVFSKKIV